MSGCLNRLLRYGGEKPQIWRFDGIMKENLVPEIDDQSLDAIREIINVGIGREAGTLNCLTHAHVTPRVSGIRIIHSAELTATFPLLISDYSIVTMEYSGAFTGTTALIFPGMSTVHLVALLSKAGSDEPDSTLIREEHIEGGGKYHHQCRDGIHR